MADPPRSPVFTMRELAALSHLERGDTTRSVQAALKVSGSWMSALRKKAGRPLRRPNWRRTVVARPHPGVADGVAARPEPSSRPASGAPGSPGSLHERLERLLSARIADLEVQAVTRAHADPESTAKALATNVRTLAILRRVGAGQDTGQGHDARQQLDEDATEAPPRSLAQLRDELRGHLQRLRLEARAGRGHRGAEPEPG